MDLKITNPPSFREPSFVCPHCRAYAEQKWEIPYNREDWGIGIARCQACNGISVWFWRTQVTHPSYGGYHSSLDSADMVHPLISSAPSPNIDLSPDIKALYLEASSIMSLSPRWACALLRLALQKLIIQAWGKGKDLNDDIWVLVKGGLSVTIQKALDTVRVIGNNAVHPGVLDINDNIDYVTYMFPLINIIANHFISEPLKISELFEQLPKTAVDGINRRDSK